VSDRGTCAHVRGLGVWVPPFWLLTLRACGCSADLSGQCYPARIARKWGDRVIEEFTAQARREESLGMPVMPFMKNLTRPLDRARLQLRFVNQVVLPLWTAMNDLLHGLAVPVDNLCVHAVVAPELCWKRACVF